MHFRMHNVSILLITLLATTLSRAQSTSVKLDFGAAGPAAGFTAVKPDAVYSKELGFGFEPGSTVTALPQGGVTSNGPFYFSVALPEGNYKVTVKLGDAGGESTTTIKAELRRLMLEKIHTDAGKFETRTFAVNVRTPQIPGGGQVRLKSREQQGEARAWDDKLTLEFNDSRPCIRSMEIEKVNDLPTVYICGDSTVCDQPGESYASWGQMLTRFFKPDVVIANHAESGESLRGFLGEKRWEKVMSLLKPGDYMIVQMGHNDEKERGEGVGAMTSYKRDLERFVADTRSKGAIPIIVSPMERRSFDGNKARQTHAGAYGDVPEAVRLVAKEQKVAMIDLSRLSMTLYEAIGPEKAYLAFAGNGPQRDATHHDNYGAYELAKCIVIGIQQNKLDLAKHIADDFKGFDPAHPDDVDKFTMPVGGSRANQVPLGS